MQLYLASILDFINLSYDYFQNFQVRYDSFFATVITTAFSSLTADWNYTFSLQGVAHDTQSVLTSLSPPTNPDVRSFIKSSQAKANIEQRGWRNGQCLLTDRQPYDYL